MAMTFNHRDVELDSSSKPRIESDIGAAESPMEAEQTSTASDVGNAFRNAVNGSSTKDDDTATGESSTHDNDNEKKKASRRTSGLAALIQAATDQLGHVESSNGDMRVDNDSYAAAEAAMASSSAAAGKPSPNSAGSSTPGHRYTPHGFHTSTPSYLAASNSYDSNGAGNTPPSASTAMLTPVLRPEDAAAAGILRRASLSGGKKANSSGVRPQTFPEILMTVLEDKTNANVITFLPDGRYFAIRRKEFADTTMLTFFAVKTFQQFLEKMHSWGFSRIIDRGEHFHTENGSQHATSPPSNTVCAIEIFRHPLFIKGDWEKCSKICFGESPTDVRLSALPDRARIEYTLSDESTLQASKRRLSPSHLKKDSEGPGTTSKQRLSEESCALSSLAATATAAMACSKENIPEIMKTQSADTAGTDASSAAAESPHERTAKSHGKHERRNSASTVNWSKEDEELRNLALAFTSEKLNLNKSDSVDEECSTPLVQRAVENATHTIVTDAIETLLRDEDHSRETYLKHERELSRSSLPGVVPISKQLFSQPQGQSGQTKSAPSSSSPPAASTSTSSERTAGQAPSAAAQDPDGLPPTSYSHVEESIAQQQRQRHHVTFASTTSSNGELSQKQKDKELSSQTQQQHQQQQQQPGEDSSGSHKSAAREDGVTPLVVTANSST